MVRQAARLIFGQAIARERLRRGRGQRTETLWRTVDHSDRHLGGDAAPVLPAMKLRKIVGAHDPDKAQAGGAAAQVSDSVHSVSRSNDGFETADVDARIVGHLARGLSALVEIAQGPLLLEGI